VQKKKFSGEKHHKIRRCARGTAPKFHCDNHWEKSEKDKGVGKKRRAWCRREKVGLSESGGGKKSRGDGCKPEKEKKVCRASGLGTGTRQKSKIKNDQKKEKEKDLGQTSPEQRRLKRTAPGLKKKKESKSSSRREAEKKKKSSDVGGRRNEDAGRLWKPDGVRKRKKGGGSFLSQSGIRTKHGRNRKSRRPTRRERENGGEPSAAQIKKKKKK